MYIKKSYVVGLKVLHNPGNIHASTGRGAISVVSQMPSDRERQAIADRIIIVAVCLNMAVKGTGEGITLNPPVSTNLVSRGE